MSIVAELSKESEVVGVLRVIWNDLLSIKNWYRHQLDTDILRQAALRFFMPDEILEGKLLLVSLKYF